MLKYSQFLREILGLTAKSIADKIDYGSILLSVREDDKKALENIKILISKVKTRK